ncbi:hypothetical protein SAMN05192575_11326 [Nocardioides alpinus]|uniref:Secreted protein n=1 Tax=Nocardioides alpinus TaxID=748909 RepID=A0A1I1B4V8_9ACTN|nr:hypothetical protein [Nocardioides alpinus]PKH40161.1 hypothetical protein CXG46_13470 [Nocardioides alpinus]SFB44676.1 hypothetical protein SAMN05192575_11326 [Nocardioides alpinus]
MRTSIKTTAVCTALATAALLVVTATTASGEGQSGSSAFGVSAGGTPGQPAIESDGSQEQTGGGQLPAQLGPLASGGVLALSAGNDRATAAVTDLTLGSAVAQLPQELKDGLATLNQACTAVEQATDVNQVIDPLNAALAQVPGVSEVVEVPTAEAAAAFCNGLLDTDLLSLAKVGTLQSECTDMTGTVTLTDVEVLGAPQPLLVGQVAPETQLLPPELAAVATITLNHQVVDRENFTVQGLRLEVGGQEVAVLASATCGGPIAAAPVAEPEEDTSNQAPVPTPVKTSVPVTG